MQLFTLHSELCLKRSNSLVLGKGAVNVKCQEDQWDGRWEEGKMLMNHCAAIGEAWRKLQRDRDSTNFQAGSTM